MARKQPQPPSGAGRYTVEGSERSLATLAAARCEAARRQALGERWALSILRDGVIVDVKRF